MSNIFFINLHASYDKKANPELEFDEVLIRSLILNMIRRLNVKYRDQYGRVVIACDGRHSWRKEIFPYYKSHRKKDREDATHIDWSLVFPLFDAIKEELKTYTNFIVIEPRSGEGDDVIATLAIAASHEKNIIISTDKDYKQLQSYLDIQQYNPKDKVKVALDPNDANDYLFDHIIKGDRGDGIPNILSDDDTFVREEKRQKSLTEERFIAFRTTEMSKWDNERHRINFNRNKTLIDLRECPENVREDILEQYQAELNKTSRGIYNYFAKYKLTGMLNCINDFKESVK